MIKVSIVEYCLNIDSGGPNRYFSTKSLKINRQFAQLSEVTKVC